MGKFESLIPILSFKENDNFFVKQAFQGSNSALVLLVVDTNLKESGYFTTSRIAKGRETVVGIIEKAKRKKKKAEELIEWGNTKEKIISTAKINGIKTIVLMKQNSDFFKDIVEGLKANGFDVKILEEPIETKE